MNLSPDDQALLSDLCRQHEVSYDKIVKLLETVREYEFKDRRSGIYDVLRDILKSNEISGGDHK